MTILAKNGIIDSKRGAYGGYRLIKEAKDYSTVEVTTKELYNEDYFKIEVRAEVSYDGLAELCEQLNSIVNKYDSYAYFEPVTAGIIDAYVEVNKVLAYNNLVLESKNNEKLTITEVEQKYNSAVTSINSSKLPALFTNSNVRFKSGGINLDVGGGKFDNVADYLLDKFNCTNLVYDPYNRSAEHNRDVLSQVKSNGGADTTTCSNVLNVIAEPEVREETIKMCYNNLKNGGTSYFTVYKGDGSGKGKANDKRQSYQTNMPLEDYLPEIENVFDNVTRRGTIIIAKK